MIAPDDRGFTLGHGLFETLLWDGELRDWEAHLGRLMRGCAVLGMPAPGPAACLEAALGAVGGRSGRLAVRLSWSAGPGGRGLDIPADPRPALTATASPTSAPTAPATLVTVAVRRNDTSPASRLKTLAYLDNVLARADARASGADEALMLNTRGEVACAAAANVFWIDGDAVCTPPPECGVLDGITRAQVLDACLRLGVPTREVRATPERIAGLPMFLTNSLIGIRPVAALDGRALPHPPYAAGLAAAAGLQANWRAA